MTPSDRRHDGAIPLSRLPFGVRARVVSVQGPAAVRQRLLDLGLLPGHHVELLRVAPGRGPLWLRVGASQLAVRRGEADGVVVQPVPPGGYQR